MTLKMKKYLGGALLDQCMEEVQHWKVAQHDVKFICDLHSKWYN